MHLTPGQYLPHSISDTLRTADDVARWLESQGETVTAAVTLPLCAYAATATGLRVYRNGWVCRPVDAEAA